MPPSSSRVLAAFNSARCCQDFVLPCTCYGIRIRVSLLALTSLLISLLFFHFASNFSCVSAHLYPPSAFPLFVSSHPPFKSFLSSCSYVPQTQCCKFSDFFFFYAVMPFNLLCFNTLSEGNSQRRQQKAQFKRLITAIIFIMHLILICR